MANATNYTEYGYNYPGTIFAYEDQSDIQSLPIEQPLTKPVFMAAITSDKGPEDFRLVSGDDFFKLYGKSISFAKHGQPLLQAAAIINAGGTLFVKRVVGQTATLANVVIYAIVQSKTDEDGNSTGECTISFTAQSVANVKNIEEVRASAGYDSNTASTVFPLFAITDIGRGMSNKKIQIVPDLGSSKNVDYVRYMLNVIENNVIIESIQFGLDPDTVDSMVNVSLESRVKTNSSQIKCVQFEDGIRDFLEIVTASTLTLAGTETEEEALKIAEEKLAELKQSNILFGKYKNGTSLPGVTMNYEPIKDDASGSSIITVNLSATSGIALAGGTNGEFLEKPIESPSYEAEMVKVFNGNAGNSIYDLDSYKIDAIVDANYPASVKRAIETFVTFREDCFYFRDLGLNLSTLAEIKAADEPSMKSKFCASYCNSYDIIDPYSKKQITVTAGYSIAKLLVSHFNNGRNRPFAGQLYNVIFSDAIEGTINFLPAITPTVNEKEELGDARINYVSLYDGVPVLETLYTSQDKHSQFSYVNNILAIQEVIKAIRTRCPKIRYSFIEGDDLEEYKKDVESVIENYTNNFMSITMEYIADPVYIANKVFYAAIKVKFKNFVQTEYFKVIALPTA